MLLALLARGFVVESFRIPSGSMAPTLLAGDHVFVWKLAYGLRVPFTRLRAVALGAPRRGDVVVFEDPRDPSRDLVKRVVGVPGDVVELREQVLYVNGVRQPRTPAGEIAYEERSDETGAPFEDVCLRFREALAKGDLSPPEGELEGAAEALGQSTQPVCGADPGLRAVLRHCMGSLPPAPARALQARIRDAGRTRDHDIAARLGMTRNTFLQNITRAKRFIADCLKRNGVDLAEELR